MAEQLDTPGRDESVARTLSVQSMIQRNFVSLATHTDIVVRHIAPVSFSSDQLRSGESGRISDESPCLIDPAIGVRGRVSLADNQLPYSLPAGRSCRKHFPVAQFAYALASLFPGDSHSYSPQEDVQKRPRVATGRTVVCRDSRPRSA